MISHNSEVEVFFFFFFARITQILSMLFFHFLCLSHSFFARKKLSEYKVNILQLQKVLKI